MRKAVLRCGPRPGDLHCGRVDPRCRRGGPCLRPPVQRQHAGRHRDRGELDRVLPGRAGGVRGCPQRCGHGPQQQRLADDDLDRRRRRPGDVRLELRGACLAHGRTVLFAGLYYGGKLAAGTGGSPAPNPGARNTVLLEGAGRHELSHAYGVAGRHPSTQYQGFANVTAIVDAAGAGHVHDRERAARHRAERFDSRRLGAGCRLRGPGRPESQPLGLRRNAERQRQPGHDPAERLPDAALGPGDLDGRDRRLRGGSRGSTGDLAQIQGGVGGFTALSNAVNPGPPATSASNSNVFNSTISNCRRARHLARRRAFRTTSVTTPTCSGRRTCSATGRRARRCGCRPAATPTSRGW